MKPATIISVAPKSEAEANAKPVQEDQKETAIKALQSDALIARRADKWSWLSIPHRNAKAPLRGKRGEGSPESYIVKRLFGAIDIK
jgi:hypothetical protein